MRKILLLGGTGAMGVYLCERLSQSASVFVTTRRPRPTGECGATSGVSFIVGNAKNLDFVKKVIVDVRPDAIIDFMTYTTEEFRSRAELLVRGCSHYVFLSTYRVFDGVVPLTERSPRLLDSSTDEEYLATDEYAITKARQEDILRSLDIPTWTIIRPAITFSKTRFQFGCLEAWEVCYRSLAGLPVVMPHEMIDHQATLSWAGDVALMIERLILNERAYSEDFNVATAEHMPWRRIGEIYADEIGLTVRECSLSDYIYIIGSQYQVMYDRMFDRIVDNRKVLTVTGLTQKDLTPVSIALRNELRAFKEKPVYPVFVISRLAKMDRVVGSRIPLRGLSLRQKKEYLKIRYPILGSTPVNFAERSVMRMVKIVKEGLRRCTHLK